MLNDAMRLLSAGRRDLEMGEDHIRGSIEGLVVDAFESVALLRL